MMRIKPKSVLISAVFLNWISVGLYSAVAQDMRPASSSLASKISAAGGKKVAIVDFTDLQGNGTQLGRFIAEELSIALAGDAKDFEVIDRSSIRVILQEHKLASERLIDPATARELGQIAGVDTLITGTITPLGDSLHVGLKALDTDTAKVLAGFTVEIPRIAAINDLLGSPSNAPSQSTADKRIPPPVLNGLALQVGDFAFEFQGCKRGVGEGDSDQIVCWGSVTNKGASREELAVGNQTYIADNTGRQSAVNFESVGGKTDIHAVSLTPSSRVCPCSSGLIREDIPTKLRP